jgi:hypothetical protein
MIQVVDLKRLCDLMPFPLPRFSRFPTETHIFSYDFGPWLGWVDTSVVNTNSQNIIFRPDNDVNAHFCFV